MRLRPHAVARLREQRLASLARFGKPYIPRASHAPRCLGCRVMFSHCLCALRPQVTTRAGICLVFPGEYAEPGRVITEVPRLPGKRPLLVLLDGTWSEARKMFRKSPYLDHLPVLSLQPEQLSRYRLRRSTRDEHLCTAEVAALCLALGGEPHAAETLETYLEVFSNHYLNARESVPPDLEDAAHLRLRVLSGAGQLG